MNTYKIINNADDISIEEWYEFVSNHPNGNIFQIPHFYLLHKKYKYSNCIINFALNEQDRIIGLIFSYTLKEGPGLVGKLTSRCISVASPLVLDNNKEVFKILLQEHDEEAKTNSVYSQFRNLFDLNSFKETFMENSYTYREHLDIIIDLTKSQEILWKEINQKGRNRVRKAKKEGVHIELSNSYEDINETYTVLKKLYKHIKLPLPNLKYFEIAYEELTDKHLKIFLAYFQEKVIGTVYVLCFKESIYGWWSGSYHEYLIKCPNDLLAWEIILWGKKNGYKKFDFLGAGEPSSPYGVRNFKKKFGGEIVNFGRFEKVNKPILYTVATKGFRILQKIKR